MSGRTRVVRSWTASYEPALAVTQGEPVEVLAVDEEWPGWSWVAASHGLEGWVPTDILDTTRPHAQVLDDFDTRELTVEKGDVLERLDTRSGWSWCRSHTGDEGWVPDTHLATD